MKKEPLQLNIAIGSAEIRDMENGIVNFGVSAQKKITKNEDSQNKNSQIAGCKSADENCFASSAVNADGQCT